ncbi:MAG: YggT family protein [Acidimicrobiales bacterium]|nr:YggT family protein [Acidimicrobiales bacterium]MDG1878700.1 YggT family protein [Acidimicrobiales bacterium]
MVIGSVLCTVVWIYFLILIGRILLSWFPIDPNGSMATVAGFLYLATDPILQPLRRVIPPLRIGNVALDLSVLIVIFAINLVILPLVCSL